MRQRKGRCSMKRAIVGTLLSVALLVFVAVAAGADELTVNSIVAAHNSGAPADGIIAMVNSPANTLAMTVGDLVTLRNAGVPESVIAAIWARIPAPAPAPVPLQPDDARLVDFVRLIKSGMSESIIAEQVKQSGQTYNLSVNDLLYLKENGAQESTIAALMATSAGAPAVPAAAPSELVFDDLVLVKTGFWNKNRNGRLVMKATPSLGRTAATPRRTSRSRPRASRRCGSRATRDPLGTSATRSTSRSSRATATGSGTATASRDPTLPSSRSWRRCARTSRASTFGAPSVND